MAESGSVSDQAARGIVKELNDPYSELLAPRQSEEFRRATGGRQPPTGRLLPRFAYRGV